MALAHAVLVTAKQANSRTYLLDSPAETETAHRHLLRYTAVCHYALVFGAFGCTIRHRASSPHQRQAASLIFFFFFACTFFHPPQSPSLSLTLIIICTTIQTIALFMFNNNIDKKACFILYI